MHSYKLHGKKASQCSKVSSISLFDNDSDKYSTSDKDTTKKSKKGSKASKLRYKLSIKSKNKKEPKKTKRKQANTSKGSKNRDTTDTNIFASNTQQARSYGVTNKAFFDTHRAPLEGQKQYKDYMIPFEVNNGILSSFSKRNSHTSFRPFDSNPGPNDTSTRPTSSLTDLNFTSSLPDIDLTNTTKTLEPVSKVEECPTYQHAWKQCNDYEALETTNGSITNLSSVTTSFEQIGNKQVSTFQTANYHCNLEKRNSNNNELISRSAKITEELEIKLKERRMMMESKSDELLQHQHQLHLQQANLNNDSSGPHSCGCPCHGPHSHSHHHHHHHHSHNHNQQQSGVSTKIERIQSQIQRCSTENEKQQSHHHRQMIPSASNGIITIPIERAYSTPNKRESIRKLIQNKAVSENKQKGELEKHLTSLLCTRANPYEMND